MKFRVRFLLCFYESPGDLVKMLILIQYFCDTASAVCISNKHPGRVDTPGLVLGTLNE